MCHHFLIHLVASDHLISDKAGWRDGRLDLAQCLAKGMKNKPGVWTSTVGVRGYQPFPLIAAMLPSVDERVFARIGRRERSCILGSLA